MEKLLTLAQVSQILGSDDPKGRYVRELRKKGILPGAKFGNKLLFKESEVERFVENQFKAQN